MDLLGEIPQVPRPFRSFDAERRLKLLQLARVILESNPCEATQRTVQYLMKITDPTAVPEGVPNLPWHSSRTFGDMDALLMFDPNRAHPAHRLLPQMRFRARLGRLRG